MVKNEKFTLIMLIEAALTAFDKGMLDDEFSKMSLKFSDSVLAETNKQHMNIQKRRTFRYAVEESDDSFLTEPEPEIIVRNGFINGKPPTSTPKVEVNMKL